MLLFSPAELAIIAAILAIIISPYLTVDEQNVLGSFAAAFGSELQLIAAQNELIETAKQELKALYEKDDIEKLKNKLAESNQRIEKLEELIKQYQKNNKG